MWDYLKAIAWVTFVAAGLSGCAADSIYSGTHGNYPANNEVPVAGNFKTSVQLKLQAAEHWKRIASYSARRLIDSFKQGAACIPKHGCTLLYLKRNCLTSGCASHRCDSTFSQVFFNEFLTALVNLGYEVSAVPARGAVVVDIDIQAVNFSPNRPQYRYAGDAVEIGPGTWAVRDVADLVDRDGNVAPGTRGNASNWYRSEFAAGDTPRNELVITTSAVSPEQLYLARNTAVYYTSDGDVALYSCPGSLRALSNLWSIPVVGDCSQGRCAQGPTGGR